METTQITSETPVDRRAAEDRRQQDVPVASDRRKVQRRRQIDPTTCERDYNGDEIEFMRALDSYKRASGRMFPTCSEILEVIRGLGYRKVEMDLEEEGHEMVQQAVADIQTEEEEVEGEEFFGEDEE